MFTKFEHFAATSLMGSPAEAPPRQDGHLHFDRDWEKMAFGVAIALSKQGHYEWEDFRQTLIETIAEWEDTHDLDDPEWDYYQCWLAALEKIAIASGIIQADELTAQMAQLLNCNSGEAAMSSLSVQLPESLYKSLQVLAQQEGISVDQFIATAVAEKISALTTETYLEEMASRGSRIAYEAVLAKVPHIETDARDQVGD